MGASQTAKPPVDEAEAATAHSMEAVESAAIGNKLGRFLLKHLPNRVPGCSGCGVLWRFIKEKEYFV